MQKVPSIPLASLLYFTTQRKSSLPPRKPPIIIKIPLNLVTLKLTKLSNLTNPKYKTMTQQIFTPQLKALFHTLYGFMPLTAYYMYIHVYYI